MKDEQLFEAFSDIDRYYLSEDIPHVRKRRSFSKIGILCALIAVILLACFSFLFFRYSQYGFHLVHENDGYYLESYKKGIYEYTPDIMDGTLTVAQVLSFSSLAEMREDFLTYNFTEDEIKSIQVLLAENGGRIEVPDLDHLCEPICPAGYTFTGKVYWSGSNHYSFEIQNNGSPDVSIGGSSKERHLKGVNRLLNYTGDEIVEVIEKRKIEDRNATMYVERSKRNGKTFCFLVYVLTQGDKTIFVEEQYSEITPDELTPDTVPAYIILYIQDGDAFASAYLQSFDYRPSAEWLLSFGLQNAH